MSSDRARNTNEVRQPYHRVVMQQGRVFLEGDWNEQQEILDERARLTLLDLVGPTGTPNDGYAITFPPSAAEFDFTVGAGTMYVGGVRLALDAPIAYSQQPDWPDAPKPRSALARELICLEVREQEVSAVEDESLREVALGGPDTAQRVRLIQQIVRTSTRAHHCREALEAVHSLRQEEGLTLDPGMQLQSQGRLMVSFPQPEDPSETSAGYLGPDNQLIRIQISGSGTFVWSYDNATPLYRVEVQEDRRTLKLWSQPVDEFHYPRADQVVEVLQPTTRLSNNDYLAAPTGSILPLAEAYNPATREISLLGAVLLTTGDANPPPYQYLRVWEQEISFEPDLPVALGDTGLLVTLRGKAFSVGDFWMIGVRSSTPNTVYPARFLNDFQPPDGPRRWCVPLALIRWDREKQGVVLEDCRRRFSSLPTATRQSGGCCTVTVFPDDVTEEVSLQNIIDEYRNRERVTVCLMPGIYLLPKPLVLCPEHSRLTLQGCHDGVVLQAAPGKEHEFIDGLIVVCHADEVTLSGLRFHLPLVPFKDSGGLLARMAPNVMFEQQGPDVLTLRVSVGIRPWHCARLTVKECLFRYTVDPLYDLFAVGVFAGSECAGITLRGNRFLREAGSLGEDPIRMLIGFLLAPTIGFKSGRGPNLAKNAHPAGTLVRPLLHDAEFQENSFIGLTIAVLVLSDCGLVRLTRNTVRESSAGFWVLMFGAIAHIKEVSRLTHNPQTQHELVRLQTTMDAIDADLIIHVGGPLALGYPPPVACDVTADEQVVDPPPAAPNASPAGVRTTGTIVGNVERLVATLWHRPQPSAPGTPESAAVTPALPPPDRSPRYEVLARDLSALLAAAPPGSTDSQRLRLLLYCTENEIDTVPQAGLSRMSLFVLDTDVAAGELRKAPTRGRTGTVSEVIVSASKLTNQSRALPTAFLLLVDRCTVTGSMFLNENTDDELPAGASLDLLPGPREHLRPEVAVTGNVFRGTPTLPDRLDPGVLPWEALNTVV